MYFKMNDEQGNNLLKWGWYIVFKTKKKIYIYIYICMYIYIYIQGVPKKLGLTFLLISQLNGKMAKIYI